MTIEKFVHVVFDETNHAEQDSLKKCVEENDQSTILQKLELSLEK